MTTRPIVAPSVVVVDTRDGYTFWRDASGDLFTAESAHRFAAVRNGDRPDFGVYSLTPHTGAAAAVTGCSCGYPGTAHECAAADQAAVIAKLDQA